MSDSTKRLSQDEVLAEGDRAAFEVWNAAVEAAQRRTEHPTADDELSPIAREIIASADRCLLLQKQIYDKLTRSTTR